MTLYCSRRAGFGTRLVHWQMMASSSVVSDSGGYEYEFVDDPVPARFQCNICMKVLRDARLTECCGQHYCDSCLTNWLKTRKDKKTCPHCRKEGFKSMINKEKIREINELRIRCTNSKKGCGWVGELGGLNDHLKSDNGCGYVIVNCYNESRTWEGKYNSCGKQLERRFLARHMENECKYRPYTCEYCGHEDTFEAITEGRGISLFAAMFWGSKAKDPSHYDQCAEYPLECPNKCGEKSIKRKDMKKHHEICPLEPLNCPFRGFHSRKILRKDIESHKLGCDYRPYSCEYCGRKGTFMDIKGRLGKRGGCHYEKCDHYPLECTNKCGKKNIKRKDMKSHRDSCPLEPLDCPFKDAGCSGKIHRRDMEKHNESSTQAHLVLMFKSYQKLMQENQELKTRLEKLEKNKY